MELSTKSLLSVIFIIVVCVHTIDSLSCYQCNSGKNYNGTDCETLPDAVKHDFINPCPTDANYTQCRKTIQTVGDDTTTVRTCATAGTQTGCIDKTGTNNVRVKYCQCEADNCNASSAVIAQVLLVFVLAISNAFANTI